MCDGLLCEVAIHKSPGSQRMRCMCIYAANDMNPSVVGVFEISFARHCWLIGVGVPYPDHSEPPRGSVHFSGEEVFGVKLETIQLRRTIATRLGPQYGGAGFNSSNQKAAGFTGVSGKGTLLDHGASCSVYMERFH